MLFALPVSGFSVTADQIMIFKKSDAQIQIIYYMILIKKKIPYVSVMCSMKSDLGSHIGLLYYREFN